MHVSAYSLKALAMAALPLIARVVPAPHFAESETRAASQAG